MALQELTTETFTETVKNAGKPGFVEYWSET